MGYPPSQPSIMELMLSLPYLILQQWWETHKVFLMLLVGPVFLNVTEMDLARWHSMEMMELSSLEAVSPMTLEALVLDILDNVDTLAMNNVEIHLLYISI